MSEFSQSDLDQEREKGRAEFQALLSKMNEACSDKEFVNTCLSEGLDFEQFQTKLVAKLQSEAAEKDAKLVELQAQANRPAVGAPPVAFSEGGSSEGGEQKLDFRARARKIASEENISFRQAYKKVIAADPESYAEFKYSKPQEGR